MEGLKMILNWRAIGVAFVVTLVLSIIFGIYLPKNVGLIGPIIGGLLAGYMVGGSYTEGLVNGGIPAGIAGSIYTVSVVSILGSKIIAEAVAIGYTGSTGTLLISAVIGGVIGGFAIYFFLGIIGSIIGVVIKNRNRG